MHPALWKLLRLRYRATLRRTLSGLKTVRGAVTFVCGLLMLVLMLGSNILVLVSSPVPPQPELLRLMAPLFLLGFTLLSLNSTAKLKAIHFWPAEVEFLFPGPFERRELLYYKMIGTAVGALFLALLFSTWITRFAPSWLFVVCGLFLAIGFVQLMQMALVLLIQTLADRGLSLSRKAVFVAVGLLLAAAIWQALAERQGEAAQGYALAFRESWVGFMMTLPFDVFGRILAAETFFPEFATWAALGIVLNLSLLALIIRLDANYLEASVAGSQVVYERMQRMRSGNLKSAPADGEARRRYPHLPRFAGAGTIARRQFIKAFRSSLWVPLIMVGVGGSVVLFLVNRLGNENLIAVLVGASVYCTFIFSSVFPFDFRSDLDQMELLKQLPFRPIAVAAGELAAPVILLSLLQSCLFVAAAVMTGNPVVAAVAALFVFPLNILMCGIENLTFLIYPVRMAAATPGDFQHFGRQMMMLMFKMLILSIVGGIAGGGGAIVYVIAGGSTTAGIAAGLGVINAGRRRHAPYCRLGLPPLRRLALPAGVTELARHSTADDSTAICPRQRSICD